MKKTEVEQLVDSLLGDKQKQEAAEKKSRRKKPGKSGPPLTVCTDLSGSLLVSTVEVSGLTVHVLYNDIT